MARRSDREYPTPGFWDADWGKNKNREGEAKTGKAWSPGERLVKVVVFTAVALALVFLNPMGNVVKNFTDFLLPNYDWAFWVVLVVFLSLMVSSVWNSNSSYVGIGYLLMVLLAIVFSNIGLTWVQTPFGQTFLLQTRCSLAALFSPGSDIMGCLSPPSEPPIQIYDALTINLDDSNSGYTIYRTVDGFNVKPLFIFVTVENPSETRTIENFKILDTKSVIRKSGNVPAGKQIEIAYLKTSDGSCMESSCKIDPNKKITLVLKADAISCEFTDQYSCEAYAVCKWNTNSGTCSVNNEGINEVEAKITYSYDYVVEGDRSLLLAKDYQTVQGLLKTTETPDSAVYGPISLGVSFAPAYHVFDSDAKVEIDVNIKFSNEGTGIASLYQPIEITRISGGSLLSKPKTCMDPWGNDAVLDENENIILNEPVRVEGSATFICTYSVDGNFVRDSGEVIPVTATEKYTYEDTKLRRFIQIEDL